MSDQSFQSGGIFLEIFQLGPLETNCYFLHDSTCAIVIDPGGEPEQIAACLERKGLKLTHILNTHLHFDHIQGNASLARLTGAPILAGSEDDYLMQTELGLGGMMGFPVTEPFPYLPLNAGVYRFLDLDCTVFATPGHSPGSRSFYFPDLEWVFVGDLVFYRSVGRTDFPGGDAKVLRRSARECILSLPEQTIIYPGHGPRTDVASESLHNTFLVF